MNSTFTDYSLYNFIKNEICVSSKAFTITFANTAFLNTFGQDAIGKQCYKQIYNRLEPCIGCVLSPNISIGNSQNYEINLPNSLGCRTMGCSLLDNETVISQMNDIFTKDHTPYENTYRLLLKNQDIRYVTEQKLTKQNSSFSIDKYKRLIREIPQPIIIACPDARIQEVNQSFLDMYEMSEEDIMNCKPSLLNPGVHVYEDLGFTKQDYDHLFKSMWKAINDPDYGFWEGTVINKTKTGKLIWANLRISTIFDADGNILNYIGLPVDITKIMQNENYSKQELYHTIAALAELRDNETGVHMRRVGLFARILGQALGLTSKDCAELEQFAPMHDIGKIGIPDELLLAPRRLSLSEFELMKNHTLIGYQILNRSKELKRASEIVLNHHEKWDGSGYPNGIAGDMIPVIARITAIADVYDALRSERPYKQGWTHEKAVEEIEKLSGKQFDPKVVDAFRSVQERFRIIYQTVI